MRRLEFPAKNPDRFWEVEQSGATYTMRWGKLGTTGATQSKTLDTPQKTAREVDRLVEERIAKGFVVVKDEPSGAPVEAAMPVLPAALTDPQFPSRRVLGFEKAAGKVVECWEIEQDGPLLGWKSGTEGQMPLCKSKLFESVSQAHDEFKKMAAAKRAEGFKDAFSRGAIQEYEPRPWRRFEGSENGVARFFEVKRSGGLLEVRQGAMQDENSIAPELQTCGSSEKAIESSDAQIHAKLRAGFAEVSPSMRGKKPVAASAESPLPAGALIGRLDRWLREQRPLFYKKLRPGISREAIQKAEKKAGVVLPPRLAELFQWRNGEGDGGPFERFLDNWSLMSLEDALGLRASMNEMQAKGEFKGALWNTHWIPFLEDGGGNNVCLDLKGVGGKPGQLIEFWHEDADRPISYDSLDELLSTFLDAVERGKWSVDSNGMLKWGG